MCTPSGDSDQDQKTSNRADIKMAERYKIDLDKLLVRSTLFSENCLRNRSHFMEIQASTKSNKLRSCDSNFSVNLNISLIAQEVSEIYLIDLTYVDISSIGGYLTLLRTSGRYAHRVKKYCLLYTSPSTRDLSTSRMPSSA